ncbi:ABC-2 type transport system permease protein [Chitinophaga dinghuensis]|uniref:ABC-2 type transport system permease protein n=1 Tax=Chitinophaga dinghuensis TaxID=1539050 RepID=A0A327VUF6_9BACT|nr:ABC transporter permease [Chitinophaga dinghuensis]RAJ79122.1 ABC-2 type transport system permease protein [Chitinophaga dinghuensis]
MKQLLVFIRKEFYHVFRDRRTLLIMFGLPVAQILLFGYALTSEVKNAHIIISDQSMDANTTKIIHKIQSSSYFITEVKSLAGEEIDAAFRKGVVRAVLIFPPQFGEDLQHKGKANVQIVADGADPNTAKTIINYLTAILGDYQQSLADGASAPPGIVPELRMLYNPEGNGSLNFIPGVIALIFMIVCSTLTSVSIVREKELGTMEILLVSPFHPIMVLIAKAIPFLVLSLVNFTFILVLSVGFLDIAIKGSILLLFAESTLFIITCLSVGLLISNIANSQQAAMLISMMGMMLPTLLLTGFMYPLDNMPYILQLISNVVPARWYYLIVKAVMLKGLGFSYIWKETLVLVGMTTVLLSLALLKFKTRLS